MPIILDVDSVITKYGLDVLKVNKPLFQGLSGEEISVKTRMHLKLEDFRDYLENMKQKYAGLQAYLYEVQEHEATETGPLWHAVRYALEIIPQSEVAS